MQAGRIAPIVIADFNPSLADDFRRLNEEWITHFFELENADRKVFADPEKEVIEPGGYIIFALEGNIAVGTVALFKRAKGEFELGKMAVTPKMQGRDIGKRLMQAAIDRAKTSNAHRIYLETHDKLIPAVNLYRSFGFTPVNNTKSTVYARVNLIMELIFSPPNLR